MACSDQDTVLNDGFRIIEKVQHEIYESIPTPQLDAGLSIFWY